MVWLVLTPWAPATAALLASGGPGAIKVAPEAIAAAVRSRAGLYFYTAVLLQADLTRWRTFHTSKLAPHAEVSERSVLPAIGIAYVVNIDRQPLAG